MKRVTVIDGCGHWANVLLAIDEGDLRPLAVHLRMHPGQIDAAIAKRLADLIDGTASKSNWALSLKRNPRLANAEIGKESLFEQWRRNLRVVMFIEEFRGARRGLHAAAVHQAAVKFGLTESAITQIWKKRSKPPSAVTKT